MDELICKYHKNLVDSSSECPETREAAEVVLNEEMNTVTYLQVLISIAFNSTNSSQVVIMAKKQLHNYLKNYWKTTETAQRRDVIGNLLQSLVDGSVLELERITFLVITHIIQMEWFEKDYTTISCVLDQLYDLGNEVKLKKVFIVLENVLDGYCNDYLADCTFQIKNCLLKLLNIFLTATLIKYKAGALCCFNKVFDLIKLLNIKQILLKSFPNEILKNVLRGFLNIIQASGTEISILKVETVKSLIHCLALLPTPENLIYEMADESLKVSCNFLNQTKSLYLKGSIVKTAFAFHSSLFLLIDFVCRSDQFEALVVKYFGTIMSQLIFYLQLNDIEVQFYLDNPNHAGLDYDWNPNESTTGLVSLRTNCRNILIYLKDIHFNTNCIQKYLSIAIGLQLRLSSEVKQEGNSDWWKLEEACFFAIQLHPDASFLYFKKHPKEVHLILKRFSKHESEDNYLLLGRCDIALSILYGLLSHKDKKTFIRRLIKNFTLNFDITPIIFAVRCLKKVILFTSDAALPNIAERFLSSVIYFFHDQSDNEILVELTLDLIENILIRYPNLKEETQTKMLSKMDSLFFQYGRNENITRSYCNNLNYFLQQLEYDDNIIIHLVRRVHYNLTVNCVTPGYVLDVLRIIVINSNASLKDYLVEKFFEVVLNILKTTKELSVYTSSSRCFHSFIQSSFDSVAKFFESKKLSLFDQIWSTISGTIDKEKAYCCGRMITDVLKKLFKHNGKSEVNRCIDEIIDFAQKYSQHSSESTTPLYGVFVMVNVYLLAEYTTEMIEILKHNTRRIEGRNLLDYTLIELTKYHILIDKEHALKICVIALCKIIELAIDCKSKDILYLSVPNIRMEDSFKAFSKSFENVGDIPFYVKALKIILFEKGWNSCQKFFQEKDEELFVELLNFREKSYSKNEEDAVICDIDSISDHVVKMINSLPSYTSMCVPFLTDFEEIIVNTICASENEE